MHIFALTFGIFLFSITYYYHTREYYVLAKDMSSLRTIKTIFPGIEQAEGVGATVRRSIGNMKMRNFSPFLMFDHFSSNGVGGFPEHPHLGQETITLMTKGASHTKTSPNERRVKRRRLAIHDRRKGYGAQRNACNPPRWIANVGLQLWVDLPEDLKEVEPRYRDLKTWEIPIVEQQDGKLKVRVISGKSYGVELIKEFGIHTSAVLPLCDEAWLTFLTGNSSRLQLLLYVF